MKQTNSLLCVRVVFIFSIMKFTRFGAKFYYVTKYARNQEETKEIIEVHSLLCIHSLGSSCNLSPLPPLPEMSAEAKGTFLALRLLASDRCLDPRLVYRAIFFDVKRFFFFLSRLFA